MNQRHSTEGGIQGVASAPNDAQQTVQHPHDSHEDLYDPEYQQWRTEQMRHFDEDYRRWRQERLHRYAEEFSQWRQGRGATKPATVQEVGESTQGFVQSISQGEPQEPSDREQATPSQAVSARRAGGGGSR